MSGKPPRADDDRTDPGSNPQSGLASLSLAVLAILVVFGAVGVGSIGVAGQTTGDYVILQGEECRPIELLGNGTESVEAFYDYRSPDTDPSGWYETYGEARELLREDTSQIFLYRGSEGLSLVFLHDGVGSNTTSGGTLETEITGLPAGGEWVVRDDEYDGQDDDTFDGGSEASASWAWNEGSRTDGGAYSLNGGDWEAFTIEMEFNENAEQYPYEKWNGEPAANEIDSWIARSDGETYALAMDEPITIARGNCDEAMAGAGTTSEDTGSTDAGSETDSDGDSTESTASENVSGGLPIDVPAVPGMPSVPNVPEVSELPGAPEIPSAPEAPGLPAIPDLPDVSGGTAGEWVGEELAGSSETNPTGALVLILALTAIALVTLRR
jgi:hypothetical protein